MPRARGVAPDALRLTERTNAAPFLGKIVGDDLRAQQLLAGFGATYGQAEDRESSRAARFLIRTGRNDADRELLLDAFGLTLDDASPHPGLVPDPPEPEPVWNAAKDCSRCGQPKPLDDYPADSTKSDGRHSRCKACQAAIDATRKTQADAPKELPAEQRCCICKQIRAARFFGRDKTTKTGLALRCRACRSEVDKARRNHRTTEMERTTTQ